jgi:hypothetical protein
MGETSNAYKILMGKAQLANLEDQEGDGRIILSGRL